MARVVLPLVLVLLLVLAGGLCWYCTGTEMAPDGERPPAADAPGVEQGSGTIAVVPDPIPDVPEAVSATDGEAAAAPDIQEDPPGRGAALSITPPAGEPDPSAADADPLLALDPQTLAELRTQHDNAPGFDDGLRAMLRRDPSLVRLFGNHRPAGPPALPAPVAPAEPGIYAVSWDDYDSTIVITDGVDDQGRRIAQVETRDLAGEVLVSYPAAAYRDADGNLQIDARGSPISGPWAGHWSPDSFRIDSDHRVHVIDDAHRDHLGDANPAGGG